MIATLGHLSLPAMLAALDDPGIGLVYSAKGLRSFRSIVEGDPDVGEPFSSYLPGAAKSTDLPGLQKKLDRRFQSGDTWDFRTLNSL